MKTFEQLKRSEERFVGLETQRGSVPQKLKRAMKIAEGAAKLHSAYQHYTSIDKLALMLKDKTLWLRRGDSPNLNDWGEWRKFGTLAEWQKTYIGCFSYGTSESALMWRMYCQPDCNAVRISISGESFAKWVNELKRGGMVCDTRKKVDGKLKASIFASDVLYGAVAMEGDRYNEKRRNALSWFCNCIHMENLGDYVWDKELVARVKEYAWRQEHETRIIAQLKRTRHDVDTVAIPFPSYVLSAMRITLSPWLAEECQRCTVEKIRRMFECAGIVIGKSAIRSSVLTGTLDQWRK